MKRSVAMIALFAFVIAAMLPLSAFAAPGAEATGQPSAEASGEPTETPSGSPSASSAPSVDPNKPPYDIHDELVVADAPVRAIFGAEGADTADAHTVLTNANVQVQLQGDMSQLPTTDAEGNPLTWSYKWSRTYKGADGRDVTDELTAENAPNYTVTRKDLDKTGEILIRCLASATASGTSGQGGPFPVTFRFVTVGTPLVYAKAELENHFEADASNTGHDVPGTMEVKLENPDLSDKNITLGPDQAFVTKYAWTTNAPTEQWVTDEDKREVRVYTPGLNGWGSNFGPYANDIQLKVDPKDLAAGAWEYYCNAEGVGIDTSLDRNNNPNSRKVFTVTTTPRLRPVDVDAYHAVANQVHVAYGKDAAGNEDRRHMILTIRADLGRNWPIVAGWMSDIVPVGAEYIFVRNGESASKGEAFKTNKPSKDVAVNASQTEEYQWQYRPTTEKDAEGNNPPELGLNQNATDKWYEATYEAILDVIVEEPSITGINIIDPRDNNEVVDDASVTCTIARGNDVYLVPVMDRVGELETGFTYRWQIAAPGTNNFFDITDSRKEVKVEYELEDRNRQLCLKDVTDDLKDAKLKIIAQNLSGVPVEKTTVIQMKAAEIPTVKVTLDAPGNMPYLRQVVDGTRTKFSAEVENMINPKRLTYQWQLSDTGEDKSFKEISGATTADWTTPALNRREGESISKFFYRCEVRNTAEDPAVRGYTEVVEIQVLPVTGQVRFLKPTENQEWSGDEARISGTGMEFEVEAETFDQKPVNYQWRVRRGTTREAALGASPELILEGGTKEKLQTGALDAGWQIFDCVATNQSNESMTAESPQFIVEVLQSETIPIVTVDPQDTEIGGPVGGTVRMKVTNAFTLSGDPVTYEWRVATKGGTNYTAVPGGTRSTLTLADLKEDQNDNRYICRVYNRNDRTQYYDTRPWHLGVWKEADIPKIITQPKDLRIQKSSVGALSAKLQVVVESTEKSNFVFTWEKLEEESNAWITAEQEPETAVSSDRTTGSLVMTGIPSDEGTYRCVIENLGGSPAGARSITDEATVKIMERNVPLLTSEPPKKQYANVGKTAMLRVVADIEPAEELVYAWQFSPDGGKSWRNCTSRDGDGYNTDTFTTMTITKEMVGYALYYRCAVTGRDHSVTTYSRTSLVIPKMPSPELTPIDKTNLRVTVDQRTGERFLTGETAKTRDSALTPQAIREAFNISTIKDAKIEVSKDGNVLKEEDPVGTGCIITLLDKDDIPLDDLTMLVMGDMLGTAEASLSQITYLAGAMKGKETMDTVSQRASDHNANSKYCEVSDLVAQAKLFKSAGGKDPEPSPSPDASASGSARPSASASARPSATASR